MYDSHLGRFLSADPVIQDPSNSQCLNRYSYCNNNPIAAVDPSGFSWFSDLWDSIRDAFKDIFHGIGQVLRNPVVGQILEIAACALAVAMPAAMWSVAMFEHFASAAVFSGVVSYAQTGSVGIGLRTAAFTLMSEYAWAETGNALGGAKAEAASPVKASLVHGAVGGGLNVIEGGSFKNGFLSAAASQALSGPISGIDSQGKGWSPIFARGLAAGIVGGTVAAATGGNFENGMMTSAFAQMFNDDGPENKGTKVVEELADGALDVAEGVAIDVVGVALTPETLGASDAMDVYGTAKIVKGLSEMAGDAAEESSGSIAERIANGHAFDKHVIKQGEFPGINSQEEFADYIQNVMDNPSSTRTLSNGRTAYWDEGSGTVVIHNPIAQDAGTAFKPTGGREYFDRLK
ncbi:MAG: hypothetical protein K0R24_1663 [Gammaproteobacteria bacterium]|nr:hypothetical protein [Gammaproteobacteria bacterium]MCE3238682.1 hypothetical protein [Gammaproteobacteria bacterium]